MYVEKICTFYKYNENTLIMYKCAYVVCLESYAKKIMITFKALTFIYCHHSLKGDRLVIVYISMSISIMCIDSKK